jgi:large subunit ribosomal protein L21
MFAVVRTGGKQYRVAAGDKIVVEKIAGEAGDSVRLDDVLLAGEGSDLRSTDGLVVSAEIVAQAKADKVIVFKKRRRHNYRRKAGHRQQHTILKITAIGDQKAEKPKKAEKPAAEQPAAETAAPASAPAEKPAKTPKAAKAEAPKAEAAQAEKAAKPKAAKAETADAAPEPDAPLKAGATKKAATKKPKADKEA